MQKQRCIIEISRLLDRGNASSAETSYFADKRHDKLVEEFQGYLERHRLLIGTSHIEITQSLNDRGTDLLLQREDCKIGFQLKSHYDVKENNFAAKVKRQLAESHAHGLDKWYLLICSPLEDENKKYSGRIAHLLNEISTLKTQYVRAYGPRNTVRYFNNSEILPLKEFELAVQRRAYEQTSRETLIEAVKISHNQVPTSIVDDSDRRTAIIPQTLDSLADTLEWDLPREMLEETRLSFTNLVERLLQLPKPSLELLTVIAQRAKPDGFDDMQVLFAEIKGAIGLDSQTLREELAVLEGHGFVQVWEDQLSWISLKPTDEGWPVWNDLKKYCLLRKIPLRDLIVDFNFHYLD